MFSVNDIFRIFPRIADDTLINEYELYKSLCGNFLNFESFIMSPQLVDLIEYFVNLFLMLKSMCQDQGGARKIVHMLKKYM